MRSTRGHLHFTPKIQVYRLASLAATLATDMGITKPPRRGAHQRMNVETGSITPTGLVAESEEFWNCEAQRAYVGCYHLSIWYVLCRRVRSMLINICRYSVLTRKVSPLGYSDYLHACARSLESKKAVPTDTYILHRLDLTREVERVYSLFNYSEADQPQSMSDAQLQVYLNACLSKINEWQGSSPSIVARDRKLPYR